MQRLENEFVTDEEHPLYLKGLEEGYRRAHEESLSLLTLLQTIVAKVFEEKARLIQEIKPELIEFALHVCEKVLRRELSDPIALIKMINSLLEVASSLLPENKIKILLHQEDVLLLDHLLSQVSYDHKLLHSVKFIPSSSLARGDIGLEGENSLLNYSIERILEDLRETIYSKSSYSRVSPKFDI